MKKIKKKSKIIFISLSCAIIALIIAGVIIVKPKDKGLPFIVAKKQTLRQEVSATGKVVPSQSADLSFEAQGKVSNVRVRVGDKVEQSDALASLANAELQANLAQYTADLQGEQSKLNELLNGTRAEELSLAQTKAKNVEIALKDAQISQTNVLQKADVDLANVYDDTPGILQSAHTKADDAINKQIDDLFTNDQTDNPKLTFETSDSQAGINSQDQRAQAGKALLAIKGGLENLNTRESMDLALQKAEVNLIIVRNFLNTVSEAINSGIGTQSTLNTYKGYVITARTNVNTELANVVAQKQQIDSQKSTNQTNISASQANLNTAQNNLQLAQDELNLKIAGASKEQIEIQSAKVQNAKANVQNTQAKIQKTLLVSPIDGIVAKIEIKIGEAAQANVVVASVISEDQYEIETNIPEIDVAKVKIGDVAKITLDAYGQDVIFEAIVATIDLKETEIEGVSTYKTVLQFTVPDERVKPGLTANIDILTAQKENVLAIPTRSIIEKNGQKIIRIIGSNNQIKETTIETGIRGSDGNTEIISGITEGDKVITSF